MAMTSCLARIKADILAYADEPSDSVKYTSAWLYDQIGRMAANLHQQAAANYHLAFTTYADYTTTEDQTNFWLPGNFLKFGGLVTVTSDGLETSVYTLAQDMGENGVTLVNPYEFKISSALATGSTLRLYYQRKAISEIHTGTVKADGTTYTFTADYSAMTGPYRTSPNYYAGSYIRFLSATTNDHVGQIRRIASTTTTSSTLSVTLSDAIDANIIKANDTYEIIPEIPEEHWDAISWGVVRKMKNASSDKNAIQTVLLEYKEARHWYLQYMSSLAGRNYNQTIGQFPYTGEDDVWGD